MPDGVSNPLAGTGVINATGLVGDVDLAFNNLTGNSQTLTLSNQGGTVP